MRYRVVFPIIVFVVLAAAGLVWTQAETRLIIIHTNDIHGQILPRGGMGGMAELATLLRSSNPDLVLDGGDMFTGTMISDEFEGKPLIEIMNRLNYQATALGNHEFDYGVEALMQRGHEAHFPILSANVDGIDGVKPFSILNVRGVRIGVIGLTTESLTEVTHPKNLKTVTVRKLVDTLETVLPEVRPRADLVVLVAHLTLEEQLRVARAFPEIRLMIAGHPHVARTTHVGTTTIVETGSNTQYVGRIEMKLAGNNPESITEELLPVRGVSPDPEIASLIAPYKAALEKRSSEKLGEALSDLHFSEEEESALPNLVADALRAETGVQIGLQNIGGIRAPIFKGPITYSAVFDVLPFQNTVVKLDLTGAQLKRLLGRLVLAVSGIRVEWDMKKPSPDRLVSVALQDRTPIRDGQLYSLAVNDFMWAGGDGLVELKAGRDAQDTGKLLRDVVANYIRKNPTVSPKLDGRVVVGN